MPSQLKQIPNTVRKHWHGKIVSANVDTQVFLIAWTTPANAFGYIEKIMISNQNSTAGGTIVKFYDYDLGSSGTKPPARASIANPIMPPLNVAVNAQVILGYDICANLDLVSGIVAQSSVAGPGAGGDDGTANGAVYVYVQWVEIEN